VRAIDCCHESPSSEITAIRRGLSSMKSCQNSAHASCAGELVDAGMAQK
jgi:hypothetical protein